MVGTEDGGRGAGPMTGSSGCVVSAETRMRSRSVVLNNRALESGLLTEQATVPLVGGERVGV